MAGYTDGIAKSMSEASMKGELFQEEAIVIKSAEDLRNHLSDYLYDDEEIEEAITSLKAGDNYLNGDYEFELYDTDKGQELIITDDMLTWFDNNSQGGLKYIVDSDKTTLLGGILGVAGEHIGDVSVSLNTCTGEVTGHEGTFKITREDCQKINEVLDMLFND